ncbi:hypothetical protein R6Q57_022007 [Mikania cordata]
MDSTTRCRTTESCRQHTSTYRCHNDSTKLRLMCSNGGRIIPRSHDKSLCYVGGETRMVVVDRHTTLLDLTHHLSKTIFPSSSTDASSFTLKYQLPSEDLDSLISVTTDEDLENMIDEYNSSSRIRLFIFPTNPGSVSSIGSMKSKDWFLNALNGSNSGFSGTSSVNCLLDLDNIPEKKQACNKNTIMGNNLGQDVHSIPDSPMMETNSSFGSASSHANSPEICVNADDHPKIVGGGIEWQFSQMGVEKHHKHHDDPGSMASGSAMTSGTTIRDHSDPFFDFFERSEHQQKQYAGFELNSMDSILSNLNQSSPVSQIQSSGYNNQPCDLNTRINQISPQKIHNSTNQPSSTQLDSPGQPLHHQQPQFIPPFQNISHHPSVAVPAASYYRRHLPTDRQNTMYYIQGMKTEVPVYCRTTNAGAPQLVRVSSNIHQSTQPIYNATKPLLTAQYQKIALDSSVEASLQQP